MIAAALGVDRAMVTRYKARGMPVDSISAAAAWKLENVRPRVDPLYESDERVFAIRMAAEADQEVARGQLDGASLRKLRLALRAMQYDGELELSRRVWLALVGYFMHPELRLPPGRASARLTVGQLAALINQEHPLPELWWYAACDADEVTVNGWLAADRDWAPQTP